MKFRLNFIEKCGPKKAEKKLTLEEEFTFSAFRPTIKARFDGEKSVMDSTVGHSV